MINIPELTLMFWQSVRNYSFLSRFWGIFVNFTTLAVVEDYMRYVRNIFVIL